MADVIKFYGVPRVKITGSEWGVVNRKQIASMDIFESQPSQYYYYAVLNNGERYQIYVSITKSGHNVSKLVVDEFASSKENMSDELYEDQIKHKRLVCSITCSLAIGMERETYDSIIEGRLLERR